MNKKILILLLIVVGFINFLIISYRFFIDNFDTNNSYFTKLKDGDIIYIRRFDGKFITITPKTKVLTVADGKTRFARFKIHKSGNVYSFWNPYLKVFLGVNKDINTVSRLDESRSYKSNSGKHNYFKLYVSDNKKVAIKSILTNDYVYTDTNGKIYLKKWDTVPSVVESPKKEVNQSLFNIIPETLKLDINVLSEK